MQFEIVPLKEAREKNLEFYFTGKPCKNGHISKRYTSCRKCKTCQDEYVIANEEKLSRQKKDLYERNKEKRLEQAREYRQVNRDKILDYFHRNKEILAERKKEYRKQNREKDLQYTSKRRASKKRAVPIWFDSEEVEKLHKESRRLFEETNVTHHVDHIVPLSSDFVCGLHWHGNMQILTASENIAKHNKYWPDMSDTSNPELVELVRRFKETVLKSEGLVTPS